jgi:hypothetical protein
VSKHTPGPWIIRPIGGYPIIQSETGVLVAKTDCSLNSNNWTKDLNTARANADLIASAPELLEALEALLVDAVEIQSLRQSIYQRNGTPFTPSAKIDQARSAIAKAKGEPCLP